MAQKLSCRFPEVNLPTQRNIIFTGTAGQLEGMLYLPNATPHAVAVIAHPLPTMDGTMDNKVVTTLDKAFTELGFAALHFNFFGVGESVGSHDEGNGKTLDAIATADFMHGEFPGLPLICAGFSFGVYVQARAAEKLQPHKLVLVAPAVGHFAPSTMLRTRYAASVRRHLKTGAWRPGRGGRTGCGIVLGVPAAFAGDRFVRSRTFLCTGI